MGGEREGKGREERGRSLHGAAQSAVVMFRFEEEEQGS